MVRTSSARARGEGLGVGGEAGVGGEVAQIVAFGEVAEGEMPAADDGAAVAAGEGGFNFGVQVHDALLEGGGVGAVGGGVGGVGLGEGVGDAVGHGLGAEGVEPDVGVAAKGVAMVAMLAVFMVVGLGVEMRGGLGGDGADEEGVGADGGEQAGDPGLHVVGEVEEQAGAGEADHVAGGGGKGVGFGAGGQERDNLGVVASDVGGEVEDGEKRGDDDGPGGASARAAAGPKKAESKARARIFDMAAE
jgi:hypothetical protein